MKDFENRTHTEGYIYSLGEREFSKLQKRVAGPNAKKPGQEYIQGEIQIATDDHAMNVVTVWFQYVKPITNKGKENETYTTLASLIDNPNLKTFQNSGTDAVQVRIDGNIGVNDFINRDGEQVSVKRFEGKFCHLLDRPISTSPATFKADVVLTGTQMREFDDESYLTVRGYTFDFFKNLIPLDLNIKFQQGIDYFLDCNPTSSNPLVTTVWGDIESNIVVKETEVESAFGNSVNKTERTVQSWNIKDAAKEPMVWDDPSAVTADEMKQALADREQKLAADRKRREERRGGGTAFASQPAEKKEEPAKNATPPTDYIPDSFDNYDF